MSLVRDFRPTGKGISSRCIQVLYSQSATRRGYFPVIMMAVNATKGRWRTEGRLAVEIEREEFSVPWQGITYEATYSGRRYPCVVAIHDLQMKIGKAALAEFSARLPEVARATENTLLLVQTEVEDGGRKTTDRIIVPLGS